MAASSPYQQNDYNAVNSFRPYQLPINSIFKAVSAQNKYWDEGALRIKQVYDTALDLQLTNKENQQIRNDFMKNAEKELQKFSSMDVSKNDVQRSAFKIFDPLLKDTGILTDDQATRRIASLEATISAARRNNNGKDYSDSNAMVALQGVYEFRNSQDRMAGQTYLENAKDFTPYYDVSKEFFDVLKNCKGPVFSSTNPGEKESDRYMLTIERSGASPTRVAGCLQTGLSEKARNQLAIDGQASYMTSNRTDHPDGINYKALGDDYVNSYYKQNIEGLNKDISEIEGRLAALKLLQDQKTGTDYKELIESYSNLKTSKIGEAKNLNDSYDQIQAGNLDFIKKNYGSLSTSIFTNRKLNNFGTAFSNEVEITKYSPDSVRLSRDRINAQQAIAQADRNSRDANAQANREIEMAKNDLIRDENGKIIKNPNPGGYFPFEGNFEGERTTSRAEFDKERGMIIDQIDENALELFNNLITSGAINPDEVSFRGEDGKKPFVTDNPNGTAVIDGFLNEVKGSDIDFVNTYRARASNLSNQLAIKNHQEEMILTEAKNKGLIPSTFSKEKVFSINGKMYSEQDFADELSGNNMELRAYFNSNSLNKLDPTTKEAYGRITKQLMGNLKTDQAISDLYKRSTSTKKIWVSGNAMNTDKKNWFRSDLAAGLNSFGVMTIDDFQVERFDPATGASTIAISIPKGSELKKEKVIATLDAKYNGVTSSSLPEIDGIIKVEIPAYRPLVDQRLVSPTRVLELGLHEIKNLPSNPTSTFQKTQPGQNIGGPLPFTVGKVRGNVQPKKVSGNAVVFELYITNSKGVTNRVQGQYSKPEEITAYIDNLNNITNRPTK